MSTKIKRELSNLLEAHRIDFFNKSVYLFFLTIYCFEWNLTSVDQFQIWLEFKYLIQGTYNTVTGMPEG